MHLTAYKGNRVGKEDKIDFTFIRSICVYVWVWMLSCVRLSVTPWKVAHQGHLPMKFSRQGYWGGLPFPSPGDLPDPGIESSSLALASGFLTGVELMYCVDNSVLVSGVQPSESIIHIHTSTPS